MKAFFIECNASYWLEIAERLVAKQSWEIKYWSGSEAFLAEAQQKFPKAIIHSNLDAIRQVTPEVLRDINLLPLDKETLDYFAIYEPMALKMMDRMEFLDSFTYQERLDHYHSLLQYWLSIIDGIKPDIVIMPGVCHMVYDYIIYIICKIRRIPTLMAINTSIAGLLYFVERFDDPANRIIDGYARALTEKTDYSLSEITEAHFNKLRRSYEDGMPSYMKESVVRIRRGQNVNTIKNVLNLLFRFDIWLKKTKDFLLSPPPANYIKEKNKPVNEAGMGGLRWRFYRQQRAIIKKQQKKYYDQLALPPDFNLPYIYFPLHMQPEHTTAPMGDVFVNQNLAIELLTSCTPQGWQIYVKEQPGQFFPFVRGESSRSKRYYDRIAAMPNVRLVPVETDPFELIDHSRAVATITGTSGWEAVVRGRPSLIFGHAWYRGCDGVHYVPNRRMLSQALGLIESGVRPDIGKIRLFAHVLEQYGFWGYVDLNGQRASHLTHAQNVTSIYDAIVRYLQCVVKPG